MLETTTSARLPFAKQLEDLYLVKCSLLPGENISFYSSYGDENIWKTLLESYPETGKIADIPAAPAVLQLKVDGSRLWFDVSVPNEYGESESGRPPSVAARGDDLSRSEQERWRGVLTQLVNDLHDSEHLIYELISTQLFPLLHTEAERASLEPAQSSTPPPPCAEERYHALLTSHHLISPTKRRNIQSWSSELNITGLAKVGYPGVIYAEGQRDQVEEFVRRIKSMQWLALRVRFVEPISQPSGGDTVPRSWTFVEKVGEVGEVGEQMRRWGRGHYVVEMGIGSVGAI